MVNVKVTFLDGNVRSFDAENNYDYDGNLITWNLPKGKTISLNLRSVKTIDEDDNEYDE